MSLFDEAKKKVLDSTDLDEKLKAATGIDLNKIDIDDSKLDEIKKLIGKADLKSLDISAIAKKAGVSSDVVNKVVSMLKK